MPPFYRNKSHLEREVPLVPILSQCNFWLIGAAIPNLVASPKNSPATDFTDVHGFF
jgi:hypothetical protein